MKPAARKLAVGSALVLTLLAMWYAPDDADTAASATPAWSGPAPSMRSPARRIAPPAFTDVLAIRPRTLAEAQQDPDAGLFASTRWSPAAAVPDPVPAPPADAAPAAAGAPPLPFRVLGSYVQAGQLVVFLQQNDMNHVVRVGDTIGDTYKVDSLDGSALKLRYLPLDQVQTLELGLTLQEK